MLKSLIAVVFPVAARIVYLAVHAPTVLAPEPGSGCTLLAGLLIVLAIAAPWHILATLRNPPYFAFTMRSAPGEYHGFFWFYFINEQLLRFLNMRYPRDYNTVPRLWFWLFHLVWLFPWSVYFPAVAKLSFQADGSRRAHALACACWTGVVLVFFTFSTTQEYYSMPCYPALALLLGSAMALDGANGSAAELACCPSCYGCAAVAAIVDPRSGAKSSDARRYFRRAFRASERLHALARTHGGSDARVVRLSSAAAGGRGHRVSGRSHRNLASDGRRAFLARWPS